MSFIEKYDSGAWRIESQLGEGAFSKVYKIVKDEFGHKYYAALKVIPVPQNNAEITHLEADGIKGESLDRYINAMVEGLISEINLVKKFEGVTNVVNYEDHKIIPKEGEVGYYILIRMELLDSLAKTFKTRKLTENDAVKVGLDICRALERMEKYFIIHRDIKPENIFVSKDGDYKLGDFGIARKIEKSLSKMSRKGTYSYMAPEVFKNQEYGASVDQYSLGIVLYRMLNNGRNPFVPTHLSPLPPSEREKAFKRRIKGEAIPPPMDASPELSRIILKACSYEPSQRYAEASDMRADLEAYAQSKRKAPHVPKEPDVEPEIEASHSEKAEPLIEHKKLDIKTTVALMLAMLLFAFAFVVVFVVLPMINEDQPVARATDAPGPTAIAKITNAPIPAAEVSPAQSVTESPSPIAIPVPMESETEEPSTTASTDSEVTETKAPVVPNPVATVTKTPTKTPTPTATPTKIPNPETEAPETEMPAPVPETVTALPEWPIPEDKIPIEEPVFDIEIKGVKYSLTTEILDLSNMQITDADLIDIHRLPGLWNLNLSDNQFTDLSLLSGNKFIKYLTLDRNQISDISPIGANDYVKVLSLTGNNITDITALSKLVNLAQLSIGYNNINNLAPLSQLTSLEYLDLTVNNVSDLSPLSELPKLRELYVKGNPLEQEQIDKLGEYLPNCEIFN